MSQFLYNIVSKTVSVKIDIKADSRSFYEKVVSSVGNSVPPLFYFLPFYPRFLCKSYCVRSLPFSM